MTWLERCSGYEVFFNRDERRTRKPASPPRVATSGGTRFLAPLDGDFGGSWIAVNEYGLTLALQNGYVDLDDVAHEPPQGFESRGLLLTSLAGARSKDEMLHGLETQDLHRFRSFLLTLFDADGAPSLVRWLRGTRDLDPAPSMPLVSSSFETLEVRCSREQVFRDLAVAYEGDPLELRLAYHESHRPARGPASVCMHRPEAHTVSFSRVEVDAGEVRFHYAAHSPCRGRPQGEPVRLARAG